MKEYIFDENDVLEVQQVNKCDLAYFYNRCPFAFRKEIENIFITSYRKGSYTASEVRKIFAHLGEVTRADVESAKKRIEEYKQKERKRYKLKCLEKWQNNSNQQPPQQK